MECGAVTVPGLVVPLLAYTEEEALGLRRERRTALGLELAVCPVEGVHPVLARDSGLTVERDDAPPDGLDIHTGTANHDTIPAAEHPKAKPLAPVEHRPGAYPRLRQLAADDVRGVAVARSVVGDAQGAVREPT